MAHEMTHGFVQVRKEHSKRTPRARTSLSRKGFEPIEGRSFDFKDIVLVELDHFKAPSKETRTMRMHFADEKSPERLLKMIEPYFGRWNVITSKVAKSNAEGAKAALSIEYPADDEFLHLAVMHRLEHGSHMGDFLNPVKVKKK